MSKRVSLPIPKSHLGEFIGAMVHTSWAKSGCVWYLEKIIGDSAVLKTPTTNKTLIADTKDLMTTDGNKDLLKPWYVYLLECADGTIYTGIAVDVDARMKQHGTKKGAKYTRTRGPFKLINSFKCETRSEALKLEYKIKQLSRKEKLEYNG